MEAWSNAPVLTRLNDVIRLEDRLERADNEYMMITLSILILFMQPGFAFLEAGSVRSKNAASILMKNLVDLCFGACIYWAFGFAFAFGYPGNTFIGHNFIFAINMPPNRYVQWFLHFSYVATATTIVTGTSMSDYETVNLAISGYAMGVVCVMGISGNLILFLTLISRRAWPQMRIFIGYLVCCDTVLLCTSFILYAHTTLVLNKVLPSYQGNFAYVYPATYTLANSAFMARIWATLALTADRYTAVCHPLWHRTQKPRYFGASVLVLFSVLSVAYGVPRFFEIELVPSRDTATNDTLTYVLPSELVRSQDYKRYYRVLCKLLFTSLAPFLLFTALTIRMICTFAQPVAVRRNISSKAIRSKLSDVKAPPLDVESLTNNSVNTNESQHFIQDSTEQEHQQSLPSGRSASCSLLVNLLLTVLSYSLPTVLDLLDLFLINAHSLPVVNYLCIISNFLVACHAASSFIVYFITCPRFRAAICNVHSLTIIENHKD